MFKPCAVYLRQCGTQRPSTTINLRLQVLISAAMWPQAADPKFRASTQVQNKESLQGHVGIAMRGSGGCRGCCWKRQLSEGDQQRLQDFIAESTKGDAPPRTLGFNRCTQPAVMGIVRSRFQSRECLDAICVVGMALHARRKTGFGELRCGIAGTGGSCPAALLVATLVAEPKVHTFADERLQRNLLQCGAFSRLHSFTQAWRVQRPLRPVVHLRMGCHVKTRQALPAGGLMSTSTSSESARFGRLAIIGGKGDRERIVKTWHHHQEHAEKPGLSELPQLGRRVLD